ncbi:MAG: hypothetical protein A2X36_06435 [Elusimicrobia bacterium GWA2_69_24]|nr:MAG: hypothetical protein A2X36_06435 [Elusimicrobia bacterium GWA2_69_24]
MRERFSFEPRNFFLDAWSLLRWPSEFFARLEPDGPLTPPTVHIALCALAAGLVDTAMMILGLQEGTGSVVINLLTIIFFPPFLVAYVLLMSLLYHGFCKLLGGYGTWRASYRALSALCVTTPLGLVAGRFDALWLPLLGYWFYLLLQATVGIHAVRPRRAWAAFGGLYGLLLLASLIVRVFA